MTDLRIAGFCKLRNEIIREGNLYRVLAELDRLCDGGVICDDASTDGTTEVIAAWARTRPSWVFSPIQPAQQAWEREMQVKQDMQTLLRRSLPDEHFDWVLWLDGDELLIDAVVEPEPNTLRSWLSCVHDDPIDIWAFHYTQVWRTLAYARTDSGFDEGWFWKLWRYQPDLIFDTKRARLHAYQFPETYLDDVMAFNDHNWQRRIGRNARAARAPFDVLHVGNVGSQLVLKACQYRGTTLESASLKRHLYFGDEVCYRRLDPIPLVDYLPRSEGEPVQFSEHERTLIEAMGDLRATSGLFVVVVPTFNRVGLLDRTLASVHAQTDERWCCIVLDDGSTDETPALMRAWLDRDPRFFYCRYEENRGGVAMNEIGMALACEFGEFWVRLGSDDYFEPHKLALDRVAFGLLPDVGALFGPYRDLHETFIGKELRNYPMDVRHALLVRGFAASWANIAVRTQTLRKVHERHGAFCDSRIRNMEDWLVNTRIAFETEWAWRGLGVDGTLYVGHRSPDDLPELVYDAVWRIGADGASQKAKQCALDAVVTNERLDIELPQFSPTGRDFPATHEHEGWTRAGHGVWRRA